MGAEPVADTPSTSGQPFRGWHPPPGFHDACDKPLMLYNSMTDRKERFVPKGGPQSKKIVWYSCGPTVYDSAHMGHSRNYMTIDILRRVLEDYFGYEVMFVMNITDVDDKIVVKARRNHLLKRYQAEATSFDQVRRDTESALDSSIRKQQAAFDEAETRHQEAASELQSSRDPSNQQHKKLVKQRDALLESAKGENHKLVALQAIQSSLPDTFREAQQTAEQGDVPGAVQKVMDLAGDQVALQLDKLHGALVTDEAIFREHAKKYEEEFWQDMESLGTRKPNVLTRVTEYMPQIVEYIQQIMDNGFAYTPGISQQNGKIPNGTHKEHQSVYFDTVAFEKSGHMYPKLNPWAAGSSALASEGESNFATTEKRNPRDFALWKASKPGEPSWPSPWGSGRPGWHIECSAMASCILGDKVDIHTGGQDLRFPHHDNELAQAEAYYHQVCGCQAQWVNYFLHSGHLSIDGLKMSKSLKNFITIREALQDFSAAQLRLMFAMQAWNKEMTFGKTMKEGMAAKEHKIKHFFNNVDIHLRKHSSTPLSQDLDRDLRDRIEEAETAVDESFRNNIDTASALEALVKLITATNDFMTQQESLTDCQSQGGASGARTVRNAATFVTRILRILGISNAESDSLGLGGLGLTATRQQILGVYTSFKDCVGSHDDLRQICQEDEVQELASSSPAAILDRLTALRTKVRQRARQLHKEHPALVTCDRIRDDTLVDLGIKIEDRKDGSSAWVAEDPETLKAEVRAHREAVEQAKILKKKKAIDDLRRQYDKALAQSKLPTVQEGLREKYSRFDNDGQDANPTHDSEGNELSDQARKKAQAAAGKARKARLFYDSKVKERGPDFLSQLEAEIKAAEANLSSQENGAA